MPDILFRFEDGVGNVPPGASLNVSPTKRFVDGHTVVLPNTVDITVSGPLVTVNLEPTGSNWCWRISEKSQHLSVNYVLVPDIPGPIEYIDLVKVDPATLEPIAAPDPIWVEQLETKLEVPNTTAQPMRLMGWGPTVPLTGNAGDFFIQTF